jgi:pimeloyl-ACP methyl ester carboxylesterase
MMRSSGRREAQLGRLRSAEREAFAHYGIDATSEMLELDGPIARTRVVRVGSGPPTVLLHGGAMTSSVWAPLVPHLAGRSLLLVDLPGCGFADPFDYRGVDLAQHQAEFVTSVLDALGLDRVALVGASMGGWFALRSAVAHPERVSALALVTAPAVSLPGSRMPTSMAFASSRAGRALGVLAPPPSAAMMRRMLATIGGKGSVATAPPAMFEALAAATALAAPTVGTLQVVRGRSPIEHLQVRDAELSACTTEVLFIWGDEDVVQPPSAGERAVGLLPNGRLEVLPGGHGLWFEQPERCGELILEFFGTVERADAAP